VKAISEAIDTGNHDLDDGDEFEEQDTEEVEAVET
jgi:hypothetical protein